jgi:hypothetical protein
MGKMSDNQPHRRAEPTEEEVEAFIEAHPEGASLEEIGAFLGLTRSRVGQLVTLALEKCARRCRARGIDLTWLPPPTETIWDRMAG